jgi:hypothetical protein
MPDEIHMNDIGTVFQLELQEDEVTVDVSAATDITIYLGAPSGATKVKTGVFVTDGSDGLIKYTTVTDDLDEVGPWQIQGKITMPAWEGHTSIVQFSVYPNIV